MLHGTHSFFAMALMETVLVAGQVPITWEVGAAVVIAGLTAPLPDIDHPHAWVTQKVPFGNVVGRFFAHRTFTHSLLMATFLAALLFVLQTPNWMALGVIVGWVSHPLIDLLNPMGVRLFYPLEWWVKPPKFLSIDVNGIGEGVLFAVLRLYTVAVAALYPFQHMVGDVRHYYPAAACALLAYFVISGRKQRVIGALGAGGVALWFGEAVERSFLKGSQFLSDTLQVIPFGWLAQAIQ